MYTNSPLPKRRGKHLQLPSFHYLIYCVFSDVSIKRVCLNACLLLAALSHAHTNALMRNKMGLISVYLFFIWWNNYNSQQQLLQTHTGISVHVCPLSHSLSLLAPGRSFSYIHTNALTRKQKCFLIFYLSYSTTSISHRSQQLHTHRGRETGK